MEKVSDTIKKEAKTLIERGLPDRSYFHVTFHDDSEAKEMDTNWRDFSELKRVKYKTGTKSVMVSSHRIKHISMYHNDRQLDLDVPEVHDVYQAVRSETLFVPRQDKQTRITGRVVGFIKDGEVVQEIFMNGLQDSILGWKK